MLTDGESTLHARTRAPKPDPGNRASVGAAWAALDSGSGTTGESLLRVFSSDEEEDLFNAKSDG